MTCACSRSQSIQRGQTKTRFRPVPGKAYGKPPCPNPPFDQEPRIVGDNFEKCRATCACSCSQSVQRGQAETSFGSIPGKARGKPPCPNPPPARAVNKRQPALPASPVDSEAMHGGPAEGRQRRVGGCTWLEVVNDGHMRTEVMRVSPVDDRRARLEAVRGGPVDDPWMIGVQGWRPCAVGPWMRGPRAVGGYARLELMHGFEIWVVSGPSFPQVETSTKWSL